MARPDPRPFSDERQPILFDDLPLPPPRRSDRRALADIQEMLDTLAKAKTQPWSERLLGWQRRRFAAFAQQLTPIEAAALTAQFEAELERLGDPIDFWAETAEG
jgi:hypothetical protein